MSTRSDSSDSVLPQSLGYFFLSAKRLEHDDDVVNRAQNSFFSLCNRQKTPNQTTSTVVKAIAKLLRQNGKKKNQPGKQELKFEEMEVPGIYINLLRSCLKVSLHSCSGPLHILLFVRILINSHFSSWSHSEFCTCTLLGNPSNDIMNVCTSCQKTEDEKSCKFSFLRRKTSD